MFVSQETHLTLDLQDKSVKIQYYDLRTSKEHEHLAQAGLENLVQSEKFDDYYENLQLSSKKIFTQGDQLNAEVTFTFGHQQELLDLLYFTNHPQTGNIVYPILELEKFVDSNGKLLQEERVFYVYWEEGQHKMQLRLKYQDSPKHKIDRSVNLADYWTN